MKKLNNKGMTAVEVLVSFVLLVVIVVSMYTTINAYKNKEAVEEAKEKVTTYKNLLEKEVNDDLVKRGLAATHVTPYDPSGNYKIQLSFQDGTSKCLVIHSNKATDYPEALQKKSTGTCPATKVHDNFSIAYGTCGDETIFPLPDLGHGVNACGERVSDLRISNIEISDANFVLDVYVGLYHPDLGTKFSFSVISPIDFS